MELKIRSEAKLKLKKMSNVMEVDCVIENYEKNGDELAGNVLIKGNYIRDEIDRTYEFNESVPFTILFKDKDYDIETINIEDFSCEEIINQGIECKFSIVVKYSLSNKEGEIDTPQLNDEIIKQEINQKYDNLLNEILEARTDENFLEESEVTNNYDDLDEEILGARDDDSFLEKSKVINNYDDLLDEIVSIDNEQFLNDKIDINVRIDNLLSEILDTREVEEITAPKQEVVIKSVESTSDVRSLLGSIEDNYTSYKVYYTSSESDIERICRNDNISVEKVYRDNKNTDFINKKRIIVK